MTRATPSLRFTASSPRDPEAGRFVVLLGFLLLVALQVVVVLVVVGLLAVAVVRLVVEDEDVLHAPSGRA